MYWVVFCWVIRTRYADISAFVFLYLICDYLFWFSVSQSLWPYNCLSYSVPGTPEYLLVEMHKKDQLLRAPMIAAWVGTIRRESTREGQCHPELFSR